LQAIFGYRNAHIFPVRVFLPQIHSLLDAAGKIKDAELRDRLKAQADGFAKFAEHLKILKK
jgi:hypothetical protein